MTIVSLSLVLFYICFIQSIICLSVRFKLSQTKGSFMSLYLFYFCHCYDNITNTNIITTVITDITTAPRRRRPTPSPGLCGSDRNNMAPGGALASRPVVVWKTGDPAGWTSAPNIYGELGVLSSVRSPSAGAVAGNEHFPSNGSIVLFGC